MAGKKYSTGEIFRLKLLLNHKGEPYTNQGTVSKVLKGEPHTQIKTAFGIAKMYSLATIKKLNSRFK